MVYDYVHEDEGLYSSFDLAIFYLKKLMNHHHACVEGRVLIRHCCVSVFRTNEVFRVRFCDALDVLHLVNSHLVQVR
jgi:hypothetical protein